MQGFPLFATPVFTHPLEGAEALLAEAAALLVAERDASEGVRVSNHGGAWHSVPDLARRPGRPWQDLVGLVVPAVREAFDAVAASQGFATRDLAFDVAVQMWGMVMPTGGYATVHDHHDASWSVALYADAGDTTDPTSGALAFVDPRRVPPVSGGVTLYPSTFTIRPATGMLVVFPGWLQHYVHPYTGARPRVTLSANVRLEPRG